MQNLRSDSSRKKEAAAVAYTWVLEKLEPGHPILPRPAPHKDCMWYSDFVTIPGEPKAPQRNRGRREWF